MLSVTTWKARSSSASRACSWYCFDTAAARDASDSASARRARCFQSPGPVPTPGIRPSHFSATRM